MKLVACCASCFGAWLSSPSGQIVVEFKFCGPRHGHAAAALIMLGTHVELASAEDVPMSGHRCLAVSNHGGYTDILYTIVASARFR